MENTHEQDNINRQTELIQTGNKTKEKKVKKEKRERVEESVNESKKAKHELE